MTHVFFIPLLNSPSWSQAVLEFFQESIEQVEKEEQALLANMKEDDATAQVVDSLNVVRLSVFFCLLAKNVVHEGLEVVAACIQMHVCKNAHTHTPNQVFNHCCTLNHKVLFYCFYNVDVAKAAQP